MSESIILEKPSHELSETTQKELAALAPVFASDTDKAMTYVPYTDHEAAAVKDSVKAKMAALEKIDIYAETDENLTDAFSELFSSADARKAATRDLANKFTERNFRGGANDKERLKPVAALADALQKYNPSQFNLQEPTGLFKYLPKFAKQGLSHYLLQFKEAQSSIEELMDGVANVAEEGIKSKAELKIFDKKLIRLAKELRIEYETFTEVSKSVEEYLGDLRERDPLKAEKIQSELAYRIAEARMDTMTTMLQAVNGSILVSSLLKTQDMIITGAKRASTSGMLILTINQTAASAAAEQSDGRELLESVNKIIGDMTEGNAAMIKEHVSKMKALASASLGPAEQLKKAFAMGLESLDELRDVSKIATNAINANIDGMDSLYQTATARLKAEDTAATAFHGVVQGSQELAASRQAAKAKGPKA
jgi:hypothetical protein